MSPPKEFRQCDESTNLYLGQRFYRPEIESEASSRFTHVPLGNPSNEIRLVRLTSDDDRMAVSIRHVKLGDDPTKIPAYHALSYTWGDGDDMCTISINGRPFRIRSNLFLFLATVHDEQFDGEMWIDQLSIDQECITERNEQVAMMAEIYAKATEVIVWLGHGSDLQEQFLMDLRDWKKIPRCVDMATGEPSKFPVPGRNVEDDIVQDNISRCLSEFFARPYWQRLWIIQELVMARSIAVRAGDVCGPWSCLADLSKYFGKELVVNSATRDYLYEHQMPENEPQFAHLPDHIEYLLGIAMSGLSQAPLFETLQRFCRSECADPRDKVYGLMAIMGTDGQVTVDYNKSNADVYLEVAAAIMNEITHCDTEFYDSFIRLRFICNELFDNMIGRGAEDLIKDVLWEHVCANLCRGDGQIEFHKAVKDGTHVEQVLRLLKPYLQTISSA